VIEYAMLTNSDSRYIIGNIGEKAVESAFKTRRSDDWYDDNKDGTIGGMTYEVKTFRLNNKTKGFWLGENKTRTMWKKVDNVDMLFFVMIPESETESAAIYLCIDHKNCWEKARRNNGEGVRSYPLSKCLQISTIGTRWSKTLYEHSIKISTYRRN
jgi:hypothetical protein